MTNEELCAALAPLTKLEDPRSHSQFQALRSGGVDALPVIPDTLVDAALDLMAGSPLPGRIEVLRQWIDTLPIDVVAVLNMALHQRPAFESLMREINRYKKHTTT